MTDKKRDDGGSFFPEHHIEDGTYNPGVSLRDWYAGMALQGFCANKNIPMEQITSWSFQYADAMIAEKRRTEQSG